MSDGKIVALDTPAELKRQFNAESVEEVFVKIARPENRPHPPAPSPRREGEQKLIFFKPLPPGGGVWGESDESINNKIHL
jgi:hypothetical protein